MNDHEKDRIAAALNQARPDWPIKSIRTMLDRPQLSDRPRRDVFVALAWIACEPGTATPARVIEAGPWWKAAAAEGALVNRHPKREDACTTCGREFTPNCCDNPTQRPAPSSDYTSHAQHARELLGRVEKRPTPEERPVTIDPRADAARAVLHPTGDGKGQA